MKNQRLCFLLVIIVSTLNLKAQNTNDTLGENKSYNNFRIVNMDHAEYIIMTNRVVTKNKEIIETELTTCFDKFRGVNLFNVKRNGLLLSVIRKKPKK